MSTRLTAVYSIRTTLFAYCLLGSIGCGGAQSPHGPVAATNALPATTSQQEAFPDKETLHSLIKKRVDSKRATGIVLGIREADGTHTVVAYGDAGPDALPLGPESVFEIGSISKVFTGILLADMAARGEVGLEDPAQKYAHPGVTIPSRGAQPIRLLDLSTHMSGLPRLPTNLNPADEKNPYADYSEDLLHEFLNGHTLQHEPGAKQVYSNLGTGLLGHVLSSVMASDWESLIRERILDPVKMPMSGVSLSANMKSHLALGHDKDGKVVPSWDIPSLAGAGALRSTADDMLRFVDANLGETLPALADAMRTSHRPRVDAGPDMKTGLNWFTKTEHGRSITWHNGGTGGFRTFVGFDAKRQIGVVVLENSTHGSDDIGFHLLDPETPLAEPAKLRKEISLTDRELANYVGVYALSSDFRINITQVDNALYGQATNQPKFRLYPEGKSEFFLKAVDAQLTFVRDQNGDVGGLVLHQKGANKEAKRLAGAAAEAAIKSIVGTERKEVQVATSVLQGFVGIYELQPTFKITISLKGDALQAQATNQPANSIFAESESKFFFKVVDAQISFVRNAEGHVTSLVLHQGGRDQSAAKIQ